MCVLLWLSTRSLSYFSFDFSLLGQRMDVSCENLNRLRCSGHEPDIHWMSDTGEREVLYRTHPAYRTWPADCTTCSSLCESPIGRTSEPATTNSHRSTYKLTHASIKSHIFLRCTMLAPRSCRHSIQLRPSDTKLYMLMQRYCSCMTTTPYRRLTPCNVLAVRCIVNIGRVALSLRASRQVSTTHTAIRVVDVARYWKTDCAIVERGSCIKHELDCVGLAVNKNSLDHDPDGWISVSNCSSDRHKVLASTHRDSLPTKVLPAPGRRIFSMLSIPKMSEPEVINYRVRGERIA